MEKVSYTIRLPVFEGPFDLLFHLIKKAEVDIWAVSITEITEQYLAYLQSMRELNLDIASEFLVMAATLLKLKSQLLLPRAPVEEEESGEDDEMFAINSPEELFRRLEEYRKFKKIAEFFHRCEQEQKRIYLRSTGGRKMLLANREQTFYTFWEGPLLLHKIMAAFLETAAAEARRPIVNAVDDYTLQDKIDYISAKLQHRGAVLPLHAFFTRKGLWEVALTLIAVLEMAKQRQVQLFQDRLFGPILVAPGVSEVKHPHGTRQGQADH